MAGIFAATLFWVGVLWVRKIFWSRFIRVFKVILADYIQRLSYCLRSLTFYSPFLMLCVHISMH